jgi:hypothetical protein
VIGAFNSVYDALKGFFSRGFWFATFLPVALFAALHLLVAALTLRSITVFGISLNLDKENPLAQLATAGPAIVVILVIVGYALQPLMPRLRGLLDGSLLPAGLHDWLRRERLVEANAMRLRIAAARTDLIKLESLSDNAHEENGKLRTAYRAAELLPGASDGAVIARADQALKALQQAIFRKEAMATAAENTHTAVLAALAVNNPKQDALPPAATADDKTRSARTNAAAEQFEGLLVDMANEALYRYQIIQTRIRVAGALENPRATLIGDARLVVESYARGVYQVDFDFLWPRLLVAMKADKADDPVLEAIETARAQVDFAVLSLVLAASIPAVWLPTLLAHEGPAWLFLVIGAATPLVLSFFYNLAFEGQLALGDVVKTAIDKSRFLVLKMLRLPEPATRSEERALWRQIANAEDDGRTTDLIYLKTPVQR